jgi:hypothetical protein
MTKKSRKRDGEIPRNGRDCGRFRGKISDWSFGENDRSLHTIVRRRLNAFVMEKRQLHPRKRKTYLVILFSSKNLCFSSSGMSANFVSMTPEKGIKIAPGSFVSIHSLIFGSLYVMNQSIKEGERENEEAINKEKTRSRKRCDNDLGKDLYNL